MKALVYDKAHSLEDFAIKLAEIPEPALREFDVLVDVHAVGINPGETFIRRTRSGEPGGRVLLGWEFAGVIVETGSGLRGFKTGDRVFGTGDMTRDGAWAERVAVDHRILARIPENLTFVDAASLPIGALIECRPRGDRTQGAVAIPRNRMLRIRRSKTARCAA